MTTRGASDKEPARPRFATSGAIILSDLEQLPRIIWPGIDAIEIGNLPSTVALDRVVETARSLGVSWALHTPLLRSGGKRFLLDQAGSQTEREVATDVAEATARGAGYVLLHAPWFPNESLPQEEAAALARATSAYLGSLGQRYGVQIVLELKLGLMRHPGVFDYHLRAPADLLDLRHAALCLDTGDWLLACEGFGIDPVAAWEPCARHTSVIHAHGVERSGQPYLWRPVHPADPDAETVRRLCGLVIDARPDATLVFEHTPHLDPGLAYDLEGFEWLRSALSVRQ